MLLRDPWRGIALGWRCSAVRFFAALAGVSAGALSASCIERNACAGIVIPPDRFTQSDIQPRKLHVGDTVHFTAQTSLPRIPPDEMLAIIRSGRVFVKQREYSLHDDGRDGDAKAGDGKWVLDLPWTSDMPKGDRIFARLEMRFTPDDHACVRGCEAQLTVEPKE